MTAKDPRSPKALRLISEWMSAEKGSAERRLAYEVFSKGDTETHALLTARVAAGPADNPDVLAAQELLPLLVTGDPHHDPDDLLDELDAIIRDRDLLHRRMLALAAKYRAIQPWSELWSREGVPVGDGFEGYEFGDMHIGNTVQNLRSAASMLAEGYAAKQMGETRATAARVRVYEPLTEVSADA